MWFRKEYTLFKDITLSKWRHQLLVIKLVATESTFKKKFWLNLVRKTVVDRGTEPFQSHDWSSVNGTDLKGLADVWIWCNQPFLIWGVILFQSNLVLRWSDYERVIKLVKNELIYNGLPYLKNKKQSSGGVL